MLENIINEVSTLDSQNQMKLLRQIVERGLTFYDLTRNQGNIKALLAKSGTVSDFTHLLSNLHAYLDASDSNLRTLLGQKKLSDNDLKASRIIKKYHELNIVDRINLQETYKNDLQRIPASTALMDDFERISNYAMDIYYAIEIMVTIFANSAYLAKDTSTSMLLKHFDAIVKKLGSNCKTTNRELQVITDNFQKCFNVLNNAIVPKEISDDIMILTQNLLEKEIRFRLPTCKIFNLLTKMKNDFSGRTVEKKDKKFVFFDNISASSINALLKDLPRVEITDSSENAKVKNQKIEICFEKIRNIVEKEYKSKPKDNLIDKMAKAVRSSEMDGFWKDWHEQIEMTLENTNILSVSVEHKQ